MVVYHTEKNTWKCPDFQKTRPPYFKVRYAPGPNDILQTSTIHITTLLADITAQSSSAHNTTTYNLWISCEEVIS